MYCFIGRVVYKTLYVDAALSLLIRNVKIRNMKIRGVKIRNMKIRGVKIRGVKIRHVKIGGVKIVSIKELNYLIIVVDHNIINYHCILEIGKFSPSSVNVVFNIFL